jgi:hypothetical protein
MPPYYFVFFSSLLSIAFEAVMMKVILPLVNNYSQQSVILRWWTTRHQLNTEDIKDNNVSPTAEAIVCNVNPIASDVTDIEQRSMNSKDDMIKETSSSAVDAISGASNIYNNSAEKEDRKLFKHLFTDLQLIAGYCIFVYVIATESSLNTSTALGHFYAYENITGKLYFSMLFTASVALALDPFVDASLNYSESIPMNKILNRYRSSDWIISLYVYIMLFFCCSGPLLLIQKLDVPENPSESEKAEFLTFEKLLFGNCMETMESKVTDMKDELSARVTIPPWVPTASTTCLGYCMSENEELEFKWLEILYCADQIQRWFYVPYVFRAGALVTLVLVRVILCNGLCCCCCCRCCHVLLELLLKSSRFTYIATRNHAENRYIHTYIHTVATYMGDSFIHTCILTN